MFANPGGIVRYSNYVGRVGGLAVALGIGTAVLSTPVVAVADTEVGESPSAERTTPDTLGAVSDPAEVGEVADDTGDEAPADEDDLADPDVDDGETEEVDTDEESTETPVDEAADTTANDAEDAEPKTRDRLSTTEDTEPETTGTDTSDEEESTPALEVEVVTDEDEATPATLPSAPVLESRVTVEATREAPEIAEPSTGIATVLSSVLSPFGASDSDVPVDSPLVWGLLAFARRQVGLRTDQSASVGMTAAALDSAAAVDPNAAPTGWAWVGSPGWFTGKVSGQVFGSDGDRDRLTYSGPSSTAKGTVEVSSRGSFTYTPTDEARHAAAKTDASEEDRADSFVVTIDDGNGGLTEVEINVQIRPANVRPRSSGSVGMPDMGTGAVTGAVVTVDSDGDPLTYTAGTPGKGSVVFNPDGTFVYTPTEEAREAAGDRGFWTSSKRRDSFTVTVDDGHGGVDTVRFTVQVAAIDNEAPEFEDVEQRDPSSWSGRVSGRVIAVDADDDRLTYSGSVTTDKGRVVVSSSGRFSYTPTSDARHAAAADGASDADKIDTFDVTVTDGFGGSLVVPVTVNIAARNFDPRITRSRATTPDEDTGVVRVTVSAFDFDGDVLTFDGPASTEKGTLVNNGDGTFTYTPTAAARHAAGAEDATAADRADTFTLAVTDGHGGLDTATVTVRIAPSTGTNGAPENPDVTVNAPGSDGAVTGTVTATDPDGNPLSYSGSATTAKGSVTVQSDGTFTYVPTPSAQHAAAADGASAADKSDTFVVTVSDGIDTLEVPVTVTILAVNTAPEGSFEAGDPDTETGVVQGTVTATDADGDTPTYSTAGTSTKGGSVTLDEETGEFTYTPTTQAREDALASPGDDTDTFTVTVDDGHGGTDTVAVSVTIAPAIQESTPGAPVASVIVAADGTHYQVTSDVDPETGVGTGLTRVSILDEDGRVLTTSADIDGTLFVTRPITRADGSLLLATADLATQTTYVSVVSNTGGVTSLGTVAGYPSTLFSVTADGTVLFTAGEVVRVSAANEVQTYELNGFSAAPPAVAPDGTAYYVAAGGSNVSVLAIDAQGVGTTTQLGAAQGVTQVVIGPDGKAYLAAVSIAATETGVSYETRIDTFTGATATTRTLAGVAASTQVPLAVGPNGVYLVTADSSTGQTSLARITATTVQSTTLGVASPTSFVHVDSAGNAFVLVTEYQSGQASSLKIVTADDDLITVPIPGQVVQVQVPGGNLALGPDGTAYVSYGDGTGGHVAMIDASGAITTTALPENVSVPAPVRVAPSGAAYQVVELHNENGDPYAMAVVALSTGAVSDSVAVAFEGLSLTAFGADGEFYVIGYQVDEENTIVSTSLLAVNADGSTRAVFTDTGGVVGTYEQGGPAGLTVRTFTFAPDGTAYVTLRQPDGSSVWAITSAGASKVLDVDGLAFAPVSIGPDGTPYLSAGYADETTGGYVTTVHPIIAPSVL